MFQGLCLSKCPEIIDFDIKKKRSYVFYVLPEDFSWGKTSNFFRFVTDYQKKNVENNIFFN